MWHLKHSAGWNPVTPTNLYGGYSSVGRASDCGSEGHGIVTH